MSAYKLVVVNPFENYKRGDQILDPEIVKKICDEKDPMHEYERFVRRVMLSDIEKQQYIAPIPENNPPELPPNEPIKISSIKPKNIDAA